MHASPCFPSLLSAPIEISEKYGHPSARDPVVRWTISCKTWPTDYGSFCDRVVELSRQWLRAFIVRSGLVSFHSALRYFVIRACSTFLQPEAFIPNGFSQRANLRANLRGRWDGRSIENLSRDVGSWRIRARNVRSNIFETLRMSEHARSRVAAIINILSMPLRRLVSSYMWRLDFFR